MLQSVWKVLIGTTGWLGYRSLMSFSIICWYLLATSSHRWSLLVLRQIKLQKKNCNDIKHIKRGSICKEEVTHTKIASREKLLTLDWNDYFLIPRSNNSIKSFRRKRVELRWEIMSMKTTRKQTPRVSSVAEVLTYCITLFLTAKEMYTLAKDPWMSDWRRFGPNSSGLDTFSVKSISLVLSLGIVYNI